MRKPLWPTTTVYKDASSPASDPWEPFESPERMAMMPPKLEKAANILAAGVGELTNILTLYEMAVCLNDKTFMNAIVKYPCYFGTHTTVVSLYRNIYITLPGLFDDNEKSVNLFAVAKAILLPSERPAILAFHGQTSAEAATDASRMIEKIKFLQRRMKSGNFPKALKNLSIARNKRFAHFDYVDGRGATVLSLRDIEICIVNAARLADLACRVLVQRNYLLPEMRTLAKSKANAMRDALARGTPIGIDWAG